MARLIDADALKLNVDLHKGCTVVDMALDLIKAVQTAPTVDAVEVKHGRWISHEGYEECGECHAKAIYPHNFCPNCGAKMDGDTE